MQKNIEAGVEAGSKAGVEIGEDKCRSYPRVLCEKCAKSCPERTIALALPYGVIRDCDECGDAGASTVVTGRSPHGTMAVY